MSERWRLNAIATLDRLYPDPLSPEGWGDEESSDEDEEEPRYTDRVDLAPPTYDEHITWVRDHAPGKYPSKEVIEAVEQDDTDTVLRLMPDHGEALDRLLQHARTKSMIEWLVLQGGADASVRFNGVGPIGRYFETYEKFKQRVGEKMKRSARAARQRTSSLQKLRHMRELTTLQTATGRHRDLYLRVFQDAGNLQVIGNPVAVGLLMNEMPLDDYGVHRPLQKPTRFLIPYKEATWRGDKILKRLQTFVSVLNSEIRSAEIAALLSKTTAEEEAERRAWERREELLDAVPAASARLARTEEPLIPGDGPPLTPIYGNNARDVIATFLKYGATVSEDDLRSASTFPDPEVAELL